MLETEFLPELDAGNICVVGVAIYIEDRYLPDEGLRVALDQIARLHAEAQGCQQFVISKNYRDIAEGTRRRKNRANYHDGGSRATGDGLESSAYLLRARCPLNRTYACAK